MASPLGRVETASVDLSADLQREAPGLEEHVWRPSERLNGLLADEYTLTVVSTRDEEGRRRFRPPNWESFAVLAAAGGLAFNQAQERYDRERVFAVRASLLLFQLQSRVGHGLARVFTRQKDLWTTSDGAGEAHVVPPDIRLASRPAHRLPSPDSISPTPADVLESGRELAREQGLERHDDATLIQLALDDAARRNPISLDEASDEELVRFVRLGLFELGPATEQVANEVYQEVIHRLLDSLEKHVELPTDEFNEW